MAHLSPKKGGFPFKDQHDRTCPVNPNKLDDYRDLLQRGSVLTVNANGEFELATGETAAAGPCYLALQDFDDLQSAMAGFFSVAQGQRTGTKDASGKYTHMESHINHQYGANTAVPRISGIHMDDGDVWELDMFDKEAEYAIGTKLAVGTGDTAGLLVPANDGDTVVGYVTKAPYTRYVNDAVAVTGLMTGAKRLVIEFQCGK